MKSITIDAIPKDGNYEGYLWRSDCRTPEIVNGEFKGNQLDKLPFVIEGWLYDKEQQVSIQIRNLDGQYFITQYDLENLKKEGSELKPQSYIAYRLNGISKVQFSCLWQEEKQEETLADFTTLVPKAHIFTGFAK